MIIIAEVQLCTTKRILSTHNDLMTVLTLTYTAYACYWSFMKLRIMHWYRLLPNQHTDLKSLVLFAALFSRFIFPLGYHYMMLFADPGPDPDQDQDLGMVQFIRVMGSIDLVPLVGPWFARLVVPVPVIAICLSCLCWRVFTAEKYGNDSARVLEGRAILNEQHY